jgi:putative FmdB family regulatory protein
MHAMPIYEYACTACGERTEAKQGFDDPPLEICRVCGGKLRKLYSPVGIVFKGSGFYSTDRKKTPRPSESKAAASDSDKGGGTKRDSDSAAKTDTKPKSKESSDG